MKMKYRNLFPLVLVLMMFVSIYSMISNAQAKQEEINGLLKKAADCGLQGLHDKAATYYGDAIAKDNSIEHYLTVTDMFFEAGRYEDSYLWAEKMIQTFPKEARGYSRAIKACLAKNAYSDAFTHLAEYDGRKLHSEEVEKYRVEMEFLHWEDGKGFDDVSVFSGGYMAFENKGKWGLATEKGSSKVKAKFTKVGYFANELVAVLDSENVWYFMNQDGEYVHNISHLVGGTVTEVGLYSNGLFPVCKDGKYSYYNLNFEKVFGEYDFAGSFSGGIAAVRTSNAWQIVDASGNSIDGKEYLDVVLDDRGVCCQKDRLFAKIGDYEYIMLDSSGKRIGAETFEGAKLFSNGEYAAIMRGELWGFVNHQGETVAEPRYNNANSFSMGLAAVCNDTLWGYIDINGNYILEAKYVECYNFAPSGVAFAKMEDGLKIIKMYKYNY